MINEIQLKHFKQFLKFGVVGGAATLMNSAMFLVWVDGFKVPPLIGNFFAFLCAFSISYLGHARWTFDHKIHNHARLIKFMAVSLIGLGINSGFVWFLTYVLHEPPRMAIIPMVCITPIMIFFINKWWVFRT